MGHEEILGVDSVPGKLALQIFRAGARFILDELDEQEAETGSPQLARGVTRLLADQLHEVARPCNVGVSHLAAIAGMSRPGVRTALAKKRDEAMRELCERMQMELSVQEALPLRLGAGMVLTTEGSVGRELQSEVDVCRILSLPNWLQRCLEKESQFPFSGAEMETEFPFSSAKKPEMETEARHLVISTSLTIPTDPTNQPTDGGLAGREDGQEILFGALLPHMSVAKARDASRLSPDVGDPDRLARLVEGLPLVAAHYAEIAEREGFGSVSAILAHRVKKGSAFDDILDLGRRLKRLRPVGGTSRHIECSTPAWVTTPEATEAYARLAAEVERRDPEALVSYYRPRRLTGNVLTLDQALLPGHEELFAGAAAAIGLRLAEADSAQKIG